MAETRGEPLRLFDSPGVLVQYPCPEHDAQDNVCMIQETGFCLICPHAVQPMDLKETGSG